MVPENLIIRRAETRDAEALIAYMDRLTNEPHNNISLDPGQWTMTLEQEREFLQKRNLSTETGIFVVGEVGTEIVAIGQLDRGHRPTNRHSATLGISVDARWRCRGIGSAILHYLLAWADAEHLIRIELKVFTRNGRAIELYRRFGFVEEGRHPYAFCKQGIWVEDMTMARIKPPLP